MAIPKIEKCKRCLPKVKEGRFDHLNHATEAVKQWPWWKREAAGFKGDTSKDDGPK